MTEDHPLPTASRLIGPNTSGAANVIAGWLGLPLPVFDDEHGSMSYERARRRVRRRRRQRQAELGVIR